MQGKKTWIFQAKGYEFGLFYIDKNLSRITICFTYQGFLLCLPIFDGGIDDKVKQLFDGEDVDLPFAEELVDVGQVFAQELEGVRMVMLHGLRDVDDDGLALVIEQVELALEQTRR